MDTEKQLSLDAIWGKHKVNLQWRNAQDTIESMSELSISSVHAVPIFENQVVLVRHPQRGWEIPGGHVDPGESPEQALARELVEEAAVSGTSYVIGSIRVDNTVDPAFISGKYPPVGHQLFYVTLVETLDDFRADYETSERLLVPLAEVFPAYQERWSILVSHAVTTALATYNARWQGRT